MKKIIVLLVITIATFTRTIGQSTISPIENTEFCPLVNQTFAVIIPLIKSGTGVTLTVIGTPTIVTGVTGLTSNGVNTTFTFVGRFSDDNNTQSFKVDFTKSNNTPDNKVFDFKKIKSLKYYSSPSSINTNISSISSQICQITTHNISFTNIRFGNGFDGTVAAYGTAITSYEYLLPVGWKLGTTTSTGAWITANNNVTITTDLTGGDGTNIQIRALNTNCGITLAKSPVRNISISRPPPPLNITGATQVCFPNSYTYNLTGVPSGAVVSWAINSYYSSTTSGNSITINPTSAANGGGNVTASVFLPVCGLTFTKSFYVSFGTPYVTFNITNYPYAEPNCYEVFAINSFQAQQVTGFPNIYSGLQWGWRNLTLGTSYASNSGEFFTYTFIPYDAGQYELWVRAANGCGVSPLESVKNITVVESCNNGPNRMIVNSISVFPNPTKGFVKIQIPKEYQKTALLRITNQFGVTVLNKRLINSTNSIDIDISQFTQGIYHVSLSAGTNKMQGKIIKQ